MATSVVLEKIPADPAGRTGLLTRQLKRQRVYIFPTIQGWLYGAMLIVMLLGAINYNNSMAFMLCFLLSSLGIVCMLHTYRNLTGLIISSSKPKAVFAGQQALFPIQFDNLLGNERFSLKLEKKEALKFISRKPNQYEQISMSIEAGKQITAFYPLQTDQRGILTSGRLMISTSFPLGIFTAWSYFEPEDHCLVYPAPYGQKQLPLNTLLEEDADYGSQSGTDDFSGFRRYRPGDPINSIAWKVFAREQGLLVKLFSGKGSQTLILSWDAVKNINDTEIRLSQLCYWILIAEQVGILYGLEIPGVQIMPSNGAHHKETCLEKLALYGQANK